MTMRRIVMLLWVSLCLSVGMPLTPRAEAKTQTTSSTIQEIDSATLAELLSTFEQAEQAMQAHDLDGIMALYSDDYHYHGLKKADIRKV